MLGLLVDKDFNKGSDGFINKDGMKYSDLKYIIVDFS